MFAFGLGWLNIGLWACMVVLRGLLGWLGWVWFAGMLYFVSWLWE